MIKFNPTEWRLFRHLQRKHKVSTEFLRYNLPNIQKIIWYETWPRIIIKRYAVRKRNRIFLVHYRLRRVLFDQANRKIIKRMKQNIRQWSKRIVAYRKRTQEAREYVEETVCEDKLPNNADDVSTKLKEQLELLKSGRRQQPFVKVSTLNQQKKSDDSATIIDVNANSQKSDTKINDTMNKLQLCLKKKTGTKDRTPPVADKVVESITADIRIEEDSIRTGRDWQDNLESTPEKQITLQENFQPIKQIATDEKTEKSQCEDDILPTCPNSEKTIKTGLNFLDMLMSKVSNAQSASAKTETKIDKAPSMNDVYHQHEHSLDSTDGFLGFDDAERIPGMLMTPVVPNSTRNNKNSAFVSETLNEYMRENDLETDYNIDEDKSITRIQVVHTDLEGLVTPKTQPPLFDMPAVPDNLLRFRTVAERKSYLQKFSKNSRLSIINNEASIYRELQKRIRFQKCKLSSQQISAQSANSAMSFSRNGWHAASFINTEFNKYYYQMLDVDFGKYKVKLKGARGNNDEFRKKPYFSKVKNPTKECPPLCADEDMWHDFKAIKTVSPRAKKLNKGPLPSVFKPCPLSHKTFQKPLDDDAAALLLAGGSMAVVRMPTIELEVFPECGRPLNEIAKRYLQYILPHHDISREWAEFSVSALKLPGSLKDAVKAATDSIPRKSFTFVIPYLNDRNHVLVRRVVDRSEKLDQSFEHSLDSELVPKTDFSFRQNLDQSDEILLTCADVVSDMINTVAISCSENSFIKNDPDMLSGETESLLKSPTSVKNEKIARPPSAASNSEAKKQSKQKRVLSELKRLNATIIDAAVKPEKDKMPCSKEYCAMGCICGSLVDMSHVREHCGKSKCMWECSCKSSNQSRIMRLETDGRTITTEDAFMLRRKATARLARMEKEFTSTIVLTENETLLINETNNDKKRRCTKVPKRYECDDDTDDEARKPSPKKTALTTIDNEKNLEVEVKELREPVYIKDTILEQLKHCTVSLVRLENMSNVVPWCMIHHLYKCFCKGRALEGKPMVIEKDENNTTIEHGEDEQQWEMDYKISTKARYTFEKVEKKKYKDGDDSDDDDIYGKYDPGKHNKVDGADDNTHIEHKNDKTIENDKSEHPVEEGTLLEVSRIETEKPKRSLEDVRDRFYASRPECCRRQIPIPRRMFLYCNRKRRLNVLKFIKQHETEKTRLLLNEHVMRSVYYHKTDNEKTQKHQERQSSAAAKEKEEEKQKEAMVIPCNTEEKEPPIVPSKTKDNDGNKPKLNEIVDLLDDDEEIMKSENLESNDTEETSAQQKAAAHDIKPAPSQDSIITVKKFGTLSSVNVGNCSISRSNNSSAVERSELMLPKISNCFSLNAKANTSKPLNSPADEQKLQQHLADLTSATSVDSPAFTSNSLNSSQTPVHSNNEAPINDSQLPPNVDSESVRDVYNSVIRTMNTLVSKKMQDVDFALKRESHIIPAPNADILCIMKWSNFLDAFSQGFAFIWQVKSKEGTYMVATIRNMMPMICEAMGVVNITALKPERVPLMGRMLLHNVRNEHTTKLAVVMQGKLSYWVVKGFLKADPATACNKPTPETHPSLTKKINVLCTSLVKQRQKDEKKKELLMSKRPAIANNLTKASDILTNPKPILEPQPIQPLPTPPPPPPIQRPLPTPPPQKQLPTPPIQRPLPTPPPQRQLPTPPIQGPLPTPPPLPPTLPAKYQQQILPQNSKSITTVPSTSPAAKPPSQTQMLNNSQNPRKRKSTSDSASNGIMQTKMDMSTNIDFRKVTPEDINEIHLPEIHKRNHKWLVLDLHNDFSHIFVPDFRDLVSLDRIQKVINFAKQKKKIVKLQFFQNAPFDAFVTPRSGRKIYFGPLNLEMKPPTLILLQSVDGQMMLRELYQLKHNIQKPFEQKTKAFWLLQMNGQTHFEVEPVRGKILESNTATATATSVVTDSAQSNSSNNLGNVVEDDDEDCMIVDEVANNIQQDKPMLQLTQPQPQQQQKDGRYNFTISSVHNDAGITITPQINSLPGPPPIRTLLNSNTSFNGDLTSLLKIPNTNTVIKPLLQMPLVNPAPSLLTLPSNTLITGITPVPASDTVANASMALPSNAVVTAVTTAPHDASYGSTIYLTPSTAPKTTNSQNIINAQKPISNKSAAKQSLTPGNPEVMVPNNDSSQCQASVQKRRRVSVVCHNPYDRTSQNIAVNAVINKILPENIQDIQVNQSLGTLKAVSTIGSTTITKITDSSADKQCSNQEQANSSKPLVFDVSFVDGGDEPAASIVIKPTPSPTKINETASKTGKPTPPTTPMPPPVTSNVNSLLRGEKPKICLKNARSIPYKVVKIPSTSTAVTATDHSQILNKLLNTRANTSVATTTAAGAAGSGSSQHNSLLAKKVLNTTNPIKITAITSFPAPKTTTKLIPNVNTPIRIAPKPATLQPMETVNSTTTQSNNPIRSLTITPVPPPSSSASTPTVSLSNTVTTAPLSVNFAKTLPTSTSLSPVLSTTATTTAPNSRLSTTAATTTTSTSSKSSGLAITSVQSFGSALPQRNNNNDGGGVVLPPHIQYGYIVSAIYTDFKFVAKRVMEEFYVKVPSVGILKLMGLTAVHNYLNKHMLKISEKHTKPGDWKFVAASKAVQMQNHQKSLLVRKTKPGTEIKLPTRASLLNGSKSDSNKSQKVVSVTSMSEPILIDD